MVSARHRQEARLENHDARSQLSIRRILLGARRKQYHRNRSNNGNQKCYRYHKYLSALIGITTIGSPVLADSVGGVSATANPIAQSSSSVQNQAIQVLQGPYISSQTGTIQCQGPTLNLTPFVTHSLGYQTPYEDVYYSPVYNEVDLEGGFDENGNPAPDGIPDSGWGDIAYHRPVRTGQKSSHNWSLGFSATISIPLDGGIQERCKTAMSTHNKIQQQLLNNKMLDYSIARLRHCGELAQKGISFAEWSPAHKICADVIVQPKKVAIAPHAHEVEISPSDLGLDAVIDSLRAEPRLAPSSSEP